MSKPSIPEGTRDFGPAEVRKRQYIFNTVRTIFERYGFQPIETPAMEQLATLTGKYGEEGDRLIFKILNNGLHDQKDAKRIKLEEEWQKMLSKPYSSPTVTERALRYDLTIPFARYVVMNQNDLALPFKRYQMQPVWRADRPQKGRYREFWQCDADVVGSNSLLNEAELICIYQQAFDTLQLPVAIKINSRKILAAIAQLVGAPEKLTDITIALDKLDKIGWEGVSKELVSKNIDQEGIDAIQKITLITGNNAAQLEQMSQLLSSKLGDDALAGIAELRNTLAYYHQLAEQNWMGAVTIDFTLARGLNYYTGIIAEVVCTHPDVKMGSIGGGGRYDDLTGLFGLKNLSGVGISFGIDRIYDVIEELKLWPPQMHNGAKILLLHTGAPLESYVLSWLKALRQQGIAMELYPDAAKVDKQMKFANKRAFEYVLIGGEEEEKQQKISVKNFKTGHQEMMDLAQCIEFLSNI